MITTFGYVFNRKEAIQRMLHLPFNCMRKIKEMNKKKYKIPVKFTKKKKIIRKKKLIREKNSFRLSTITCGWEKMGKKRWIKDPINRLLKFH